MKPLFTHEYLKTILTYNQDTGDFKWANRKGCGGTKAGWIAHDGYIHIRINGSWYCAHRLAWLYMTGEWPEDEIDHINRNKADNRFANLRQANNNQNAMNAVYPIGVSGYRGVTWNNFRQKWQAAIRVNGKKKSLGRFTDPYQGALAYDFAAIEHHGKFAVTNFEYN